jgi:preprotein translocase subunit SecG
MFNANKLVINKISKMKKLLAFTFVVAVLGLAACSNNKKTEQEIDSLNQASADSLLNAALADTSATDSTLIDSILVVDSTRLK